MEVILMPNEEKTEKQKQMEALKQGIKQKKQTELKEAVRLIATRDKLERDYSEDILKVSFGSSSETERTIESRRPTQQEMMTIMRLSAEAALYEGKMDPTSLKRMVDIYEELPKMAASLSVDTNLDEKFWQTKVSFGTLQNFITEVIRVTQQGTLTAEETENFR
jgi:hypothetical protein